MAYQTGSLSGGPDSLLSTLATFLSSNGWTINDNCSTDNSTYYTWTGLDGSGKRLHIQKTASAVNGSVTMYFNLRSVVRGVIFDGGYNTSYQIGSDSGIYYSEVTGIGINGSTGYSAGNSWDKQPGYAGTSGAGSGSSVGLCISGLSTTSIPNYWFFADSDTVIVVVEYESGKFEYLAFGCLEKGACGSYGGGQFVAASLNCYNPGYVQYLDDGKYSEGCRFLAATNYQSHLCVYVSSVDGKTGWLWDERAGNDEITGYTEQLFPPGYDTMTVNPQSNTPYCWTVASALIQSQPNHFNGMAVMLPALIFYGDTSDGYRFMGTPKNLRCINTTNYSGGDEITIGSDTWVVFPSWINEKTYFSDSSYPFVGWAIKKVT